MRILPITQIIIIILVRRRQQLILGLILMIILTNKIDNDNDNDNDVDSHYNNKMIIIMMIIIMIIIITMVTIILMIMITITYRRNMWAQQYGLLQLRSTSKLARVKDVLEMKLANEFKPDRPSTLSLIQCEAGIAFQTETPEVCIYYNYVAVFQR